MLVHLRTFLLTKKDETTEIYTTFLLIFLSTRDRCCSLNHVLNNVFQGQGKRLKKKKKPTMVMDTWLKNPTEEDNN